MNGSLPATTSAATSTRKNGTSSDAAHLIELLRTLADPIRLRIVRLLEADPQLRGGGGGAGSNSTGGLSVGELGEILKLPQSTVSRHLKTLTEADLAEARRDGTSMMYRLSEAATRGGQTASKQLRQLARATLDHDGAAKNDTHRLAAVLRKRDKNGGDSFFGKHAPHWDQLRAQWFGDTFHLEGLLALLNPAWTVADIGAGTGAMLPVLAPHVQQVIAVDPSAAMLKGAKARVRELGLTNVELRQGSAEALPLADGSADVALLALVLAYTTDPGGALKEVKRILKPAGIVLLIDLQPHAVELFREKLGHRWMGFEQAQLTQWLMAAGFSDARWHPLSPRHARAKESDLGRNVSGIPIPDLFVMRAQIAR